VSAETLSRLIRQAESLSRDERLRLALHLLKPARKVSAASTPRRKWIEICGLAASPMAGEDAQHWVSRTRRESDQEREPQWKPAE
jgi:hypothetical protein